MSTHDPRYAELVARLRRVRRIQRLTQKALGLRVGKSQSFVSKYETCERRLDPIELLDLCAALGVAAREVLEGLGRSGAEESARGSRVPRGSRATLDPGG